MMYPNPHLHPWIKLHPQRGNMQMQLIEKIANKNVNWQFLWKNSLKKLWEKQKGKTQIRLIEKVAKKNLDQE